MRGKATVDGNVMVHERSANVSRRLQDTGEGGVYIVLAIEKIVVDEIIAAKGCEPIKKKEGNEEEREGDIKIVEFHNIDEAAFLFFRECRRRRLQH